MPTRVPVAEGLFTWPAAESRLLGSRCLDCGNHMFPAQDGCPRCTGSETETVELSSRGTLWTWTVQGFAPKKPPYVGDADPETFQPYGVGYVELPGELQIETRLTEAAPENLAIGMEMELTLVPLTIDEEGNEVMTFAFTPVHGSQP